ncbi:MAG: rhomboid family intramembrane serine protease [Candidatus Thermoplasmatota archaeon]|nr:rhomboid family intramembrane serine protease [Candidatus Thermoplasmatota archaeon]
MSGLDWSGIMVLTAMLSAAIAPFIWAVRSQTSVALATVLSLLLVSFVQFAESSLGGFAMSQSWIIGTMGIKPSIMENPAESYRMVTAAWLHADWIHVLGNIIVVALVGVPLEQRLGARRWISVYCLGFIGGNIAWILTHPESSIPAIGASGAAFGLLGAYMACWPDDKIEFPLLFLIRAWPVWLIVFVRLGLEVWQIYDLQTATAGQSNVAHMAHVGGFFLAYLLARPLARGAPSPLDESTELSGVGRSTAMRERVKNQMGSLDDDPWSISGKPLQGAAERILSRLREEGDELETRRAWLEELSENAICPACDGEIVAEMEGEICLLRCTLSDSHLKWP